MGLASTVSLGWNVLKNKALGRHSPFIVQLTLLNRCNYQCSYCYAEYYDRPGKDLPLAQIKQILDELEKAGTFRVNLVGGEPMIRPDIEEIVDYGNQKGFCMVMTTNGYFVRKKMNVVKKLYSVCISLDGDEAANDANRGKGTFQKTMDGIEACRENGIGVNFSTVLTRHSVDQVDFMVGMAKKYGGWVDFTTLISQDREGNQGDPGLKPPREKLNAALTRILDLKKAGENIGFSVEAYRHDLQWPDYGIDIFEGKNPDFNDVYCLAGRDYIFIDYNGDIYPCPQQVGLMKHGNIFKDGFAQAYATVVGHTCRACPQTCTTDLSLFFGLRPGALISKYRQSRRPPG